MHSVAGMNQSVLVKVKNCLLLLRKEGGKIKEKCEEVILLLFLL